MRRLLLDHFGLVRPYRFERTLLAVLAFAVLLALAITAWMLWKVGGLFPGTQRAFFFWYLLELVLLALALLRFPKVALVVLMWATIELGLGIATRLLPQNIAYPVRFAWHPLLQVALIPSFDVTMAGGAKLHHTSQGTRGREPTARELSERTIIAVVGGSSTYDVNVSDSDTWAARLEQVLGDGFLVINHGVPGYSTVEHVIQTAFYQDKFGKRPRCAVYYVGWNDIRNAHIDNLDPAYADFHLPSQVDTLQVRRLGTGRITFSPLLTLLTRLVGSQVDTVQYSWTLHGTIKPGSDPALEADFERNLRTISAINRERGVRTLWVPQLLNRDWLRGDGQYGWFPYVLDKDVWPLQARFNEILARTAQSLGDPLIPAPIEAFGAADFSDEGHFSIQGAAKFAGYVAPVVARECGSP